MANYYDIDDILAEEEVYPYMQNSGPAYFKFVKWRF